MKGRCNGDWNHVLKQADIFLGNFAVEKSYSKLDNGDLRNEIRSLVQLYRK